MVSAHAEFMAVCHEPLAELLEESERQLLPALRPDPLREPWHRFRPLRLSREEDWADWLAHLVETCPDAELCEELFGVRVGAVDEVLREVSVQWGGLEPSQADDGVTAVPEAGLYRADMLVLGSEGALHVEVKVGDPHLDKTWPTGRALRDGEHAGTGRGELVDDVLLVLPRQVTHRTLTPASREALNARYDLELKVVDWAHVALCLRRRLWQAREVSTWAFLARVFVGAVEQTLLGYAYFDGTQVVSVAGLAPCMQYLKGALKHEQSD